MFANFDYSIMEYRLEVTPTMSIVGDCSTFPAMERLGETFAGLDDSLLELTEEEKGMTVGERFNADAIRRGLTVRWQGLDWR